LVHGFGVEQEETEITEKYICHCVNRAGAYVGLPSLIRRLSPVAPVAAKMAEELNATETIFPGTKHQVFKLVSGGNPAAAVFCELSQVNPVPIIT